MTNIVSVIIQLLVPLIVYITVLILTSTYYIEYIRGKSPRTIRLIKIVLVFISLLFFGYVFHIVYSIVSNTILAPLALALSLAASASLRRPKCEKEEEAEVDGIEYIVCYSNVVNAWYNPKTRKIYISSTLKKFLSDDEIKAVLYHEEGHARNKLLTTLSLSIRFYWLFAIASILLLLAVLWKANVNVLQTVTSIMLLLFFASTLTLTAMIISWVAEHESDKRALEKAGLKSILLALIKIHIYGALGWLLNLVERVEIKSLDDVIAKNASIVTWKIILVVLLVYSWKFPMWIHELVKTPVYHTHPPLELRLALLAHYGKRK